VKHVTNPTAITSVDSTAEPAAAAAAAAASPPSQAAVNENTFANRSYTGNTALGETANVHSISQSEKPRTRILAEYLAYGYHISDQIIEQGIQFDRTNGISEGFQRAIKHFDVDFAAWDSKHHVSERAKQADDKHHFLNHARHAWNSIESYFEKALDTPRGLKLRQFYQEGNKTVRDVHGEARHLADLMDVKRRGGHDGQSHSNKEGEDCTCGKLSIPRPHGEDISWNLSNGLKLMHLILGSVAAYCPCPTGSCHCTNCAKNSGAAGVFVPQNVDGVNPSLSEGSKLTSQ
jgi:hypothetical protein